MRTTRTTKTWKAMAAVALAAVLSAACTSAASSPGEAAEAPATSSPARATEADTDGTVIAAYLDSWDIRLRASQAADPDHPLLAESLTGRALADAVDALRAHQATGRAVRLPDEPVGGHVVEVVERTDTRAVLRDCAVDDWVVYVPATGAVVNDEVVTLLWEAELVRDGGVWKVERQKELGQWAGVASCSS